MQWHKRNDEPANMSDMLGVTMTEVVNMDDERIVFRVEDGREWEMLHYQDCCEYVGVEDICGDLKDLEGSPLVESEEVEGETEDPSTSYEDSYTWTFYKLRTAKGAVTIRWLGRSNGYYSESVDFVLSKPKD